MVFLYCWPVPGNSRKWFVWNTVFLISDSTLFQWMCVDFLMLLSKAQWNAITLCRFVGPINLIKLERKVRTKDSLTLTLSHTHTKMISKEKSPRRKHGKWGKKCRIMMILVLLFRCKNWSKSTNKQECQSIYCGRYFLLFRFSRGASDLNQPPFTVSHCIWQIVYHVMAQKRPKHLKWTQVHTFLPLFHFFFPHIILSLVRFSASMCRIARLLFPFYFCPFDC